VSQKVETNPFRDRVRSHGENFSLFQFGIQIAHFRANWITRGGRESVTLAPVPCVKACPAKPVEFSDIVEIEFSYIVGIEFCDIVRRIIWDIRK